MKKANSMKRHAVFSLSVIMRSFLLSIFLFSFPVYSFADVIYEDAEDGATAGWSVYDSDPAGAVIDNVYDDLRASRVIRFSGSGTTNGYRLRHEGNSKWHNSSLFIVEWSMNYSDNFII